MGEGSGLGTVQGWGLVRWLGACPVVWPGGGGRTFIASGKDSRKPHKSKVVE